MSSVRRRKVTRIASVVAALSFAVTVVGLVMSPDPAIAKPSFLGDFNGRYGTAGTALDSCSVCHTNAPSLNSYGADWKNNNKNFGSIESRDSDGDGWTNLQEIQARTMPGSAASHPPPPTTTTQPPTTTTTTTSPPGTTTVPPSSTTSPPTTTTTTPPTTTMPPPGNGDLVLRIDEFTAPGSVNVTTGNESRSLSVKASARNADRGENVSAAIKLYRNGRLEQTLNRTKRVEDDGRVDYEVSFSYTFRAADVPQIEWWAVISVDGQNSSASIRTTVVTGPPPPTTTTQPPTTTTQPPTTTTQPPTTTTQPPGGVNGEAIYASSCSGCHGASGEGGFGGPVAGTSMSLSQVRAITRDGNGAMPAFSGQLTGEEINAVARFVLRLGNGQPPPTTTTTTLPPGTPPGSGSALYRQNCAGCHGASAEGGPGGPLAGSSLSFSQQVAITRGGRGSMPAFKSVLTAEQIDLIIRYVAGLGGPGTTPTTTLPAIGDTGASIYDRLCSACHGPAGSGGSGGPINATDYRGSELAGVINAGIGTMPAFAGQLDEAQLALLVAYVEGLGGGIPGSSSGGPTTTLVNPEEGFAGHAADPIRPPAQAAAGAGSGASISPLPINSPLGWSLGLSIAAAIIAVASAVTGVMPKEIEQSGD